MLLISIHTLLAKKLINKKWTTKSQKLWKLVTFFFSETGSFEIVWGERARTETPGPGRALLKTRACNKKLPRTLKVSVIIYWKRKFYSKKSQFLFTKSSSFLLCSLFLKNTGGRPLLPQAPVFKRKREGEKGPKNFVQVSKQNQTKSVKETKMTLALTLLKYDFISLFFIRNHQYIYISPHG